MPSASYGIPGGGLFNDIYAAHRAAGRTEYVTLKPSPHLKGGDFCLYRDARTRGLRIVELG